MLFASGLSAQYNRQDKQLFQFSWHFGRDRQFYESSLERSFGKTSVIVGIGGNSNMGSDIQYVSPADSRDMLKRLELYESKTLDKFPDVYTTETYLESSVTKYRGAYIRVGVSHYFQARNSALRLSGLYTGVDFIGMQTFEHQTLTYRIDSRRSETWTASGENKFYTLGIALKAGYVWFPMKQDLFCVRVDVSHPFYIPFTENINLNSPFTGGHFEGAIGIGLRIAAR
ncbi:MAG: hypothetical protein MUC87_07290 [Bacteroidia bacterium]|nr:hypothetical protein [Bacteroidia bacterium]